MIRSATVTVALTALLIGCGNKDDNKPAPTPNPTEKPAETQPKPAPAPEPAAAQKDIVDTAIAAGSFKTLVAAVQAAEMVDALKGEGPLTVFAPNDEAFAKIPKATLDAVLADKEKLQAILKHHVVAGKVMAKDVAGIDEAAMLDGNKLAIDKTDGVKIGAANVIKTDIEASNGVIHVIDTVLLPE